MEKKCTHCLRGLDNKTKDHVFTRFCYTDNTPSHIQRWTVPSCSEFNEKYGEIEKDLFHRLAFCVDSYTEEAKGIVKKALKSFGIGESNLSEEVKKILNWALVLK